MDPITPNNMAPDEGNPEQGSKEQYEKQQMEHLFGSRAPEASAESPQAVEPPAVHDQKNWREAVKQTASREAEQEEKPGAREEIIQKVPGEFAKTKKAVEAEQKTPLQEQSVISQVQEKTGGAYTGEQIREQLQTGYETASAAPVRSGQKMQANKGEAGEPQTRSRAPEGDTGFKRRVKQAPSLVQKAKKETKEYFVNSFFDKVLGVQTFGVTTAMKLMNKLMGGK